MGGDDFNKTDDSSHENISIDIGSIVQEQLDKHNNMVKFNQDTNIRWANGFFIAWFNQNKNKIKNEISSVVKSNLKRGKKMNFGSVQQGNIVIRLDDRIKHAKPPFVSPHVLDCSIPHLGQFILFDELFTHGLMSGYVDGARVKAVSGEEMEGILCNTIRSKISGIDSLWLEKPKNKVEGYFVHIKW